MLTMNCVKVEKSAMTTPEGEESPGRVACRAPRILLGEDDVEMRSVIASVLRRDGYDVVEVADGVHLLHRLMYAKLLFGDGSGFDLVISDVRMPELTGLGVLASLQGDDAAPPVILITAFGDRQTHAEAERLGALSCLDKPFDIEDFRVAVRGALAA